MGAAAKLAELWRQNIGFALFLAWDYIALHGCAMAIGTFVPYNLEYIWLASGAGMVAAALGVLALMRCHDVEVGRRWGVAAMACSIAGNIALWLSYAVIETYWVLFAVAGVLDGIAIVLFTGIWGMRLMRCNEARIEFDVVACFVVSFALYALTLPIKLYGVVNLAVACILPPLSVWLAFRERPSDPDLRWRALHAPNVVLERGHPLPELRALRTALVMMAAEWFLVAFFRVVDAPIGAYDRYGRYLIAFAVGFVVAAALFTVLIRVMRYVNLSMSYRWLLPFVMLNLAVLFATDASFPGRVASYAVIHAGMFGMQMSLWIALLKYLRRNGGRPGVACTGMALVQGVGIFAGCGLGLLAVKLLDGNALEAAVLSAVTVAVLVLMMTGYNPSWYFVRGRRGTVPANGGLPADAGVGADGRMARGGACEAAPASAGAAGTPVAASTWRDGGGSPISDVPSGEGLYDELMHRRAEDLRRAFGLTERETEVAELLLCGRSRPYIRDELGISLNTVHAHARSILAKCGVHSQRELIDLPIGPETGPVQ